MAVIELDSLESSGAGPSPSTLRYRRQSAHDRPPGDAERHPPSTPPSTLAVATGLGLLTTFTLPPKYDHLSIISRLWLQSRVIDPPPSTSEDKDQVEFASAGQARRISWRNLKIGVDIFRLLGPRTAGLILHYRNVLALPSFVYLVSVVVDGVLPTAALWASGQMLDLVEKSFAGSPATWATALRIAAMTISFEVLNYMSSDVFNSCYDFLRSFTQYHLERLHMSAVLNHTVAIQEDETFMAVVCEAGVFAGVDSMHGIECPPHDAWWMVSSVGELVSTSIELGLQTALVFGTLRTAMQGSSFSVGNSILIGLSLAPLCFSILSDKLTDWFPPYWLRDPVGDFAAERELSTYREFVDGQHREELILFNLKPYILQRWDKLSKAPQGMSWNYDSSFWIQLSRLAVSELITNAFYVLLAVRAIPSTLTLGAIHLHRSSAEQMHSTIRRFKWKLDVTWQLPYFLAAMFASQEGPIKRGPQLNYERHRRPGGMRLEARDLGLTYDGTTPTLRDINITVEPGESLAVVGFNGSGKTTLVRALLGLHSHSGTLLINDIPFEDFDTATLHFRMSCLFQDYDRYNLPVRQNVGFGNTDKMENDEALNSALERGGASTVVQGIGGLDRWLSSFSARRHGHGSNKMDGGALATPLAANSGAATPAADTNTDSKVISAIDSNGAVVVSTSASQTDGPVASESNGDSNSDNPAMLSGGQWQRIALARAFLRHGETDLIVLDEPSASLDARTEKELFDTVHSLTKRGENGRTTCIFISHRFATVKKASKIAFVEEGRIVEHGTHAELMEFGGRYAEMYNIQKSAFDD
ncbi:uncharacterized protein CcaverHIS019_0404210 [Cutaneotrichosporon cavernicola]|uniref:ABC transporter domain-containing protein n=1 Tax=Cutaneotrichosporon cavernicola TaxID=279322 RepID=A0AA48L440_9TREE|nr:uncharacterized protein CcaverHIS019_0404210 [Cutaneotrichosporon cavernicola]BEI91601.1 hypothetical protein CcaverHIS019_0404210 [Cutaneotrichosporon cavernicola]